MPTSLRRTPVLLGNKNLFAMTLWSYIAVVARCQAGDIKGFKINVQICFGNHIFLFFCCEAL